jgi:hypothetical protein
MDPHHFRKPDPHQNEKSNPDPHHIEKLDPDPQHLVESSEK